MPPPPQPRADDVPKRGVSRREVPRRRVPRLLLGIGALLAACGGDSHPPSEEARRPAGFWFDVNVDRPAPSDLGELGYAPGSESPGTVPEEDWVGVRVHDASAADPGPFLFASGHEPAAFVLDAKGEIERAWSLSEADESKLPPFAHPTQRAWRRVLPLADGGVLAIHEGLCLLRLDAESRVLWSAVPGAHHDIVLLNAERVAVLDRRVITPTETSVDIGLGSLPSGQGEPFIVDDGVAIVSLGNGEILDRWSLLGMLAGNDGKARAALRSARQFGGWIDVGPDGATRAFDPLHANGLTWFAAEGRAVGQPQPAANGAELTVLLRDAGALLSFSVTSGERTRLVTGDWIGAHDPRPIPGPGGGASTALALFDNLGVPTATGPASQVLRVDPVNGAAEPIWRGTPPGSFFSPVCGAIASLPSNGGWLVTETTAGRALQIDSEGRLVWEFRTPFRVTVDGDVLVAALLDMRPL